MQLYMSKTIENLNLTALGWAAEMWIENFRERRGRHGAPTLTFNGYGSLSVHSARRPNTRDASIRATEYAATWDQWGILLSNLFFLDPMMKVGGYKRPYYDGVDDFHRATGDRFKRMFTYADLTEADLRAGVPAHRDHMFRFDPSRGGFTVHVSRCVKGAREGRQCEAVMVR